MQRKIIEINEEKCSGCGACAAACHEGAIAMVNGKAHLMRDDYCDGLGDCLPSCPTGAITFTEREAAEYSAEAVIEHKLNKAAAAENEARRAPGVPFGGCPGSRAAMLKRPAPAVDSCTAGASSSAGNAAGNGAAAGSGVISELTTWPVQIKLAPVNAPYFSGAKLLIAADCTAYSRADFHDRFMKNHVTLIGCPKLDSVDYSEKLTEILKNNEIKSVTVVRMEVPCCGGIEYAVKTALQNSGKMIPWQVVTLATNGEILD
ncbi:MAG: 4Fe-4S binding protein [Lachnospiraceae bacterium]|jgi:ferredoxin|nr:4Fe-4S binding protein [Lachnospiraceae bacterium]MCI1726997.1 4Fe-4S binding protein [Lachnospiraceae bacterium]